MIYTKSGDVATSTISLAPVSSLTIAATSPVVMWEYTTRQSNAFSRWSCTAVRM